MTRINCIFIAKIKQILVQPGRKKKKKQGYYLIWKRKSKELYK